VMKKNRGLVYSIICFFVLALIAFILFFLLRGEISTSGEFSESIKSDTLVCSSNSFKYPFLNDGLILNQSISIKNIFHDKKISMVSLVVSVLYPTNSDALAGSSRLHAEMNTSFGDVLGPDALEARYTVIDNVVQISLTGEGDNIANSSRKYLLLNDDVVTKQEILSNYVDQGFNCE